MTGETHPSAPGDYENLLHRLETAESTLAAIQSGEVDGLVITGPDGIRIFTLEGADAFYRELVERMPEGAAAVGSNGRVLYANSALAQMLGVAPETLVGSDFLRLVDKSQFGLLWDLLQLPSPSAAVDFTLVTAAGDLRQVSITISPVEGYAEGARCVVILDLTKRHLAEGALREAEARFRGASDNAPVGMALLDLDGLIEQANPALASIAGVRREALVGRPLPWDLGRPEMAGDPLAALLTGESDEISIRTSSEHPSLGTLWLSIQVRPLAGADGLGHHFIAQVQDESERRLHELQLRYMADHDGLTGLLNRRGFEQAMTHHLALAKRYGATGALLIIDVDHFKYINDSRGHRIGDRVLARLSSLLVASLRQSDIVARLGGDEFAVLLPKGGADDALVVADHMVDLARSIDIGDVGTTRRLTISVGVAPVNDPDITPSELMAQADLAMYDAKDKGRDGGSLYHRPTTGRTSADDRLTWLARIEAAIAEARLTLDAQPIVDLGSRRVVQQELLVRLMGEHGPITAGEWIGVAERCGLAPAIDEWVVERAIDLLAGHEELALNVNVSTSTIGRAEWLLRVRSGFERTGVDPGRITFEITETAAVRSFDSAVRFTKELRALGCRLALDDFGAGFGSFYYLKHLPFDDVKIDGEFIRGCVRDERDQTIIRAMVEMASAMGRRTVAECIEDEATLDLVQQHCVDLAQEFHLGRPRPIPLIAAPG